VNIGELARPITIYWDLTPVPSFSLDYGRICDQVTACKPLQLQLLDGGPELSAACLSILEHLRGAPLAVTLTAKRGALTPAGIDNLVGLGLRGLLLHAASYSELAGMPALEDAEKVRPTFGIAFEVTGRNWRELPLVAAYCLEKHIASMTLPMQRLYVGEPPFMMTSAESAELADLLAGIDLSGLRLTIHDPFLWRAFHPTTPFPGGGCQAANTMLAIAPDAKVYPCPALPQALGSLTETTLAELVAGDLKNRFRAAVGTLPDGCRECPEQAGCHGGCRGRSLVVGENIARPDPACDIAIHEKG